MNEDYKAADALTKIAEDKTQWETILKGAIYIKLTGVSDSNNRSLPCRVRTDLEESILQEFKRRLEYHSISLAEIKYNK